MKRSQIYALGLALLLNLPAYASKPELEESKTAKHVRARHIDRGNIDTSLRIGIRPLTAEHVSARHIDKGRIGIFLQNIPRRDIISLDLSGHHLDPDKMRIVIRALANSKSTLTKLDLGGSDIGSDGIAALALALAGNSALTELDLGRNKIDDDGMVALKKIFETNGTLLALNNTQNDPEIKALLERNQHNRIKKTTTLFVLALEAWRKDNPDWATVLGSFSKEKRMQILEEIKN